MAIDQECLLPSKETYLPVYAHQKDICDQLGKVMKKYNAREIGDFSDDSKRVLTYRIKGAGFLIAKISGSNDSLYSKGFRGLNGDRAIAQLSFLGFDGKFEMYAKIRSDLQSSLTIPNNRVLQ